MSLHFQFIKNFLYTLQGIEHVQISGYISPMTFKNSLDYEPDDTDIFVNSFTKCGTTWLQMIVHLMKNNLQSPETLEELILDNFLGYLTKEKIEEMEKPRQIKTHFPFELVPFNPNTKYIYITRNPFDCCVSLFHHHRAFYEYEFDGTFDEFFEMFLRGEVAFGNYFHNVRSWYAHKDDPNIHFMLYEDLKNNPEDEIVKLGRFLGGKYEQDVMNKDFVKEVIEKSNFKTMSKFTQMNSEELQGKVPSKFIRKGVIGDYKNMFSESQFERLYERYSQELSGTTLEKSWTPFINKMQNSKTVGERDSRILLLKTRLIKNFLYTLQGIEHVQITGHISPITFKNSLDYEPDDSDIFINSFPKCGTTWLQMIVHLMKNNLQSPEKSEELIWDNFLGYTATKEQIEEMEKPRQIKTHFPFELVPFNPKTKYIYITRNPFDCCVSLFHHHRILDAYEFDGTFDEFFEMFLRGEVAFGNYFHNVRSWYAHKDDPNIHFMLYEDLKNNPEDEIVRLGRFLGGKYEQDVMNKDFVKEVIEKSNFKTMSKFVQKNSEERKSKIPAKFIRKGVIGDYRNIFSESQFERLFERKLLILSSVFKIKDLIDPVIGVNLVRSERRVLTLDNYLGITATKEKIEEMEKPRQIKTHFPFELVPFNPNTKYIYITRNPFDCCVSLFHHHRAFPVYEFDGTFDEFFEMFLRGEVEFGNYFHNVKSWYAHKDDPNIHFMLYEDLKNNPEDEIVRLGRFLGGKYEQDVMNKDFVKEVIEKSNFKTMSKFAQKEFRRTEDNKVDLEINLSKTKVMFNRNVEIQSIMTGNVALDQVDRYTYLGQLISIHRDWEPAFIKHFMYTLQGIEHVQINGYTNPVTFKNSLDYEPDDTDIFVNSFPKCGTTWLQMIVWLMKNNLQSPEKLEDLTLGNYLGITATKEKIEEMEKPRQIKTHFPFELVPFNPNTKYIYITRNPFDCCVSLFHHHRAFPEYEFDGNFDEFFEMFLRGEVDFGNYFHNVKSWYEHKDDPNIHFMLYEDLKSNPEDEIVRLGRFLGGKYEQDVMNKDFVKEVIEKSNFKTMSKFAQKNSEGRKSEVPAKLIRKGVIGDYKNMFSKSQFERLFESPESHKKLMDYTHISQFIKNFLYTLQGIEHVQIAGYTSPMTFKNSLDYEPDDTDIFVNSYLKCGTTWLQMIVWLMKNNLQSPEKLEEVDFGNYFHNVKSWYEHKDDPNIHFMLYEDLKNNPEDEIVKLGRFLGGKYEQDVMNKDFVKEVIEKSNFKTMSKFAQKNSEGRKSAVPAKLIRKGVIGDYKNMFSKSQFERLFERYSQELSGTTLEKAWTPFINKIIN
ncbi:Sulfotransferase 1C2 [Nymphon striatum]|nr:Sulfotransferase 1C2 [Nymphon striatum]